MDNIVNTILELLGSYGSIVGLALDILGVIIIYRYGLGSTEWVEKGSSHLVLEVHDTEGIEKRKRRCRLMAPVGLGLLVTGFALQIAEKCLAAR